MIIFDYIKKEKQHFGTKIKSNLEKMDFSGKKVLVTGAGRGIGRAICTALVKSGAAVYALSKTKENLDSLKKECPEIHCLCVDLCDTANLKKEAEKLPDGITMLVNNAAYANLESFLDVTEEAFDKTMNINVKSVLFLSQIMAKKMISNGKGGSIVNVSSQASLVALPNHTSYCTSKGALDLLTKMMALELGPHQIRVNAVNPTVVMTEMGRQAWEDPEKGKPMLNRIPQGKFAEVDDVVRPIMYLLSDQSDMINGIQMPIDGGFLACATMK